ncbi:tryptophan--tRNA ligase [Bdellovibrio bacteriovorus]|uniref:Tryptophan--tRNA ligase n=1 Tax=Bdellovibrio bacteriovorus (strain ATCC 15356 / DSM 50701 / NCIMB 9529 / HD100) TaxID=264462 RepID=Q6MQG1_BDEBA|nr:tryptophan--tRNA ligase [Bdellovibrio bacteriovorus]AHZ86119.1 tryptophan--tRNA ligase [Bdellovibrio bacteriovorus]BEV67044.1 Tryptophan--tRNA ligase 2 [Bdellovibrio bacteriovorus]CAE78486.1 Tryptophan--tRNA ligase [Bdellovibrio bacteriovorus HD100]
MKPIILTGDRPTGPLHLGHYVGSLKNRVDLQDSHDQYIIIADVQALTDNYDDTTKVRDNILQVTLDYLAAGIDPAKSTIFVQSELPELFEMTTYFMNLVTVARLERNPTVKTEIQQKNLEKSLPAGFLTYPVSQAADILGFKANLVPAGEDQNPMIEQTNEIAQRFNHIYKTDFFKPVKGMPGVAGRLPGIDGKAKMSKSLGNAIYLSDDADTIKKKVQKMYTDPGHIRIEDPGKVEGNVVFSFLDVFDPRKEEVAALKEHYQRGGLGDGTLKVRLTEVLNTIIAPMRERRAQYAQDPQAVLKICKEGSLKAQEKTRQTLKEMKAIMGVGL